ncbi:eukaryotic translation initiation factor [Camillea tinctor]|nr:eukaryotic translation initiation factor [Camillea tinctor]
MSGTAGTGAGGSGAGQHATYDGASDRPPRSRRPSTSSVGSHGSHRSQGGSTPGPSTRSRAGSQTGQSPSKQSTRGSGSSQKGGFANPLGYDPGKEDRPKPSPIELLSKRVDLPADAFIDLEKGGTPFTKRPECPRFGKPIQVKLNVFPILEWTGQDIYQYDFNVQGNKNDSRALVQKCWASRPVQDYLGTHGGKWLYDGNKLAWSSKPIERNEARFSVDLDALKGKTPVGKSRAFSCQLKQTAIVRLAYLREYLMGKIPWDTHVLECMNFLDHCLRQWPSENLILIRRNFYPKDFTNVPLATYCEAHRGFYSAIRLSDSIHRRGSEIALRMMQCHKKEWRDWRMNNMIGELMPIIKKDKAGKECYLQSDAFALLRRFLSLRFHVNHRGKMVQPATYKIKRILWHPHFGSRGATSKNVKFTKKFKDGSSKELSVWDHYFEAYQIRLRWPDLPILESTRGDFFPMEVCNVAEFQRYPFRLDPSQTQNMLKFAVSRPQQRKGYIEKGINEFNWKGDPYLKAFGIKIADQMADTPAQLLDSPTIVFGNQKHNPGTSGRWNLQGKKFLEPNKKTLSAWAFIKCGNSCQFNDLELFAHRFSINYRNHGGRVVNPAHVLEIFHDVGSYGEICNVAFQKTCEHFKTKNPDMLIFVVESMNQLVYERIKKNMDCRFNCPSQVLNGGHIVKRAEQYMSNVSMKVNAKLGGITSKVDGRNPDVSRFFNGPTMIIGLDVSHASPGSSAPSMAAMTVSMDKHAAKYAASCEVNGWRVEILDAVTTHKVFTPMLKHWIQVNGVSPVHVYLLRDGVAEGQFHHVIDREVKELRRIFREQNAGQPKFTVIIATKRHHIRFFPNHGDRASGDRFDNPLPGTLVEHVATHPHHWDFYMCSHVAIQGTARPVHYQVIYDEMGVPPRVLQEMLYQHCYQYCRSTTPVSLHPAVYYAHLASQRARSHENIESSAKELPIVKAGFPFRKDDEEIYSGPRPIEPVPLIPMKNQDTPEGQQTFLETSMWFV